MAYPQRSGLSKHAEMAIPIILLIIVGIVVGVKFFNICPPGLEFLCGTESNYVLLVYNGDNPSASEEAESFGDDINTIGIQNTVTMPVAHSSVVPGSITSKNVKLVVLYGDDLALKSNARKEITNYVENGGSLLILRGAGLKQIGTASDEISPWIFNWNIDDMDRIIEFEPDCPKGIDECTSVEQITVTRDQMSEVELVPRKFDHPVIKRSGIKMPRDIDLAEYEGFNSIVQVNDLSLNTVSEIHWRDAENKLQTTPAIIAYGTGSAGMPGGRVVYLAYNPMKLDQETLFRNTIQWVTKEI